MQRGLTAHDESLVDLSKIKGVNGLMLRLSRQELHVFTVYVSGVNGIILGESDDEIFKKSLYLICT